MSSTIDGVKNTFSSWDACMSKTYCKWPVIAAIIIGSLIALSLIWCCVRCLCCGMQCCCGICACCNACCPSPRGGGRSRKDHGGGYQQAPPTPFGAGYAGGQQYHPPPPMNTGYYGAGGGMRGGAAGTVASTATFDTPGKKYHEDSLPPMPSWDTATSKRVEHHDDTDDVELEKMQPTHSQQEVGLLAHDGRDERYGYGNRQEAGDLGAGGMMHANPYQDYASPSPVAAGAGGYHSQTQHQQRSPYGAAQHTSPYGAAQRSPDPYAQTGGYGSQPYRAVASPVATASPSPYGSSVSAGYPAPANPYGSSADYHSGQQQQPSYGQQQQRGYAPSIAAPSYHTTQQDIGIASPVSPPAPQQYQAFGRKPVQGSWREV